MTLDELIDDECAQLVRVGGEAAFGSDLMQTHCRQVLVVGLQMFSLILFCYVVLVVLNVNTIIVEMLHTWTITYVSLRQAI